MVAGYRPQQEIHNARPAPAGRSIAGTKTRRRFRRFDRELSSWHYGEMEFGIRPPRRLKSSLSDGANVGIRSNGTLSATSGIRLDWRGYGRFALCDRIPGSARLETWHFN